MSAIGTKQTSISTHRDYSQAWASLSDGSPTPSAPAIRAKRTAGGMTYASSPLSQIPASA